MTTIQVIAVLNLLISFNVSQDVVDKVAIALNNPVHTVYLSSTFVHADGEREKTKNEVFHGVLSADHSLVEK